MKISHLPRIDLRYWAAIFLASVFGTNMGDLYANESGLGIGLGLAVLAVLTALVFLAERFEDLHHEIWYWLVIVIIRTGATNIADWLAYSARVPAPLLVGGLAAFIALFAWWGARRIRAAGLPQTNAGYWLAMLGAGVFGTVVGDMFQHSIGAGVAAIGLSVLYVVVLRLLGASVAKSAAVYWSIVVIARTAGTAVGDWLAESESLHIGLPLATLITGIALAAVIVFWKGQTRSSSSLDAA
jgi:uncharacterized membrane-anchored protein